MKFAVTFHIRTQGEELLKRFASTEKLRSQLKYWKTTPQYWESDEFFAGYIANNKFEGWCGLGYYAGTSIPFELLEELPEDFTEDYLKINHPEVFI